MKASCDNLLRGKSPEEQLAALKVLREKAAGTGGRAKVYYSNPVNFVRECFTWPEGQAPTSYQLETLGALLKHKRIAIRGPRGLGKTAELAWLIWWFSLTREAMGLDWKVVTTASVYRQLTKYLWPEVHKWAKRIRWDKVGRPPVVTGRELLDVEVKLAHGRAFAVASDNAGTIEGAHADEMLFIFDESKIVPDATFDSAEGALSGLRGSKAYAVAVSTPGPPMGRFYDIHRRKAGYEDWWPRHVTQAEVLAAGQMDEKWANQRKAQWGEKSALYQNHVLGEFCAQDESSVIPLSWVMAAVERWQDWKDSGAKPPQLSVLALDVSDGGSDRSILCARHGLLVPELEDVTQPDPHATMALAGLLVQRLTSRGGSRAVVDSIGCGAGIVSRLRELEVDVTAFNAAEGAGDLTDESGENKFQNVRAAAWWALRDKLNPETGESIALPDDPELIGDLTAPSWKMSSSGKIQIESKDDIRKRLGRSTDRADAVVMAFYVRSDSYSGGFLGGSGSALPSASLGMGGAFTSSGPAFGAWRG